MQISGQALSAFYAVARVKSRKGCPRVLKSLMPAGSVEMCGESSLFLIIRSPGKANIRVPIEYHRYNFHSGHLDVKLTL